MAKGDGYSGGFANEAQAIAQGMIAPVTVANLLKHYQKYGLDNSQDGYRGRPGHYSSYAQVRADALVHVARSRLTEEAYIQVLEAVGYLKYEDKAREDWRSLHNGNQT